MLMKMVIAVTTLLTLASLTMESDFIKQQKNYERVKVAFAEKGEQVKNKLKSASIDEQQLNIIIVAYKQEQQLLIYAKNKTDNKYKQLVSYPICANSGVLGPKRKQGDMQVPEGFYHINVFNPVSNFYLSLGINYPNAADKRKTKAADPGGAIFIHGSCVTIGCLPMTDDKIKEIYLYALKAKQSGQNQIPVYIFPCKMTAENMKQLTSIHKENPTLLNFWQNIQAGYTKFEAEHVELKVKVDEKGDYKF